MSADDSKPTKIPRRPPGPDNELLVKAALASLRAQVQQLQAENQQLRLQNEQLRRAAKEKK